MEGIGGGLAWLDRFHVTEINARESVNHPVAAAQVGGIPAAVLGGTIKNHDDLKIRVVLAGGLCAVAFGVLSRGIGFGVVSWGIDDAGPAFTVVITARGGDKGENDENAHEHSGL